MYKIKQLPEDFVVIEIPGLKLGMKSETLSPESKTMARSSDNDYSYFWMKKKGKNTLDVIKELARQLGIKEKNIGFAGSKDRHAETEQLISVRSTEKDAMQKIKIENVSLKFIGCGKKPVSLGELEGNMFKIAIRNIGDEKVEKITLVENYFDQQRFSKHNAEIGRHILKRDFAKAVSLLDDTKIIRYLENKANDFVGALKLLPLRLLRMYVNAYQSYLWNKTAAAYLYKKGLVLKKDHYSEGEFVFVSNAEKFKEIMVPLIGFSSQEEDYDKDYEYAYDKETNSVLEIKNIIDGLMDEEKISCRDFIIKQIPELTLEGGSRSLFVKVSDLKVMEKEKDELNHGKNKIKVSFSLPKGSYATMVVRRIVS